MRSTVIFCLAVCFAACGGAGHPSMGADGSIDDAAESAVDLEPAAVDAADAAPADAASAADAATKPECEWGGAPGTCISTSSCSAIADHTSEAGSCPGPADIQCCIVTPNPANNPPTPAGYHLMTNMMVTADMTAWAVTILHDPVTYPMFSTTTKTFMTQLVLARVEWHPPDFQNMAIHRGVTLYIPN